jgi:hypothetical protein
MARKSLTVSRAPAGAAFTNMKTAVETIFVGKQSLYNRRFQMGKGASMRFIAATTLSFSPPRAILPKTPALQFCGGKHCSLADSSGLLSSCPFHMSPG